jgi:hypothetical protein
VVAATVLATALATILATILAAVLGSGLRAVPWPPGPWREPEPSPALRMAGLAASPDPARAGAGPWAQVLHQLDRRRERAFALGDPQRLATVYTRRSAALAADRAAMAAYLERGLTVDGASFRLLDVHARRLASGDVVLRAVDRLRPVTARTASGADVPLPRDRPPVHRLVLRRGAGGWRIAAVVARSG